MTWLTWRQNRWETIAAVALVVAIGVGVLLLSIEGSGALAQVARVCSTPGVNQNTCGLLQGRYLITHPWPLIVAAAAWFPALLGTFVGATMVAAEVDNGTHVMAWSQGITRSRWFLTRVAVLAAGAVVLAAILAAVCLGWFGWETIFGTAGYSGQTLWDGFDIGPPVLIANTLFALALGVAAGAAIHRTGVAMAVTTVGYFVIQGTIAAAAARYLAPLTVRSSLYNQGPSPIPAGGLAVGSPTYVNAAGHTVSVGSSFCVLIGGPPMPNCPAGPLYTVLQYQPGSRFWLFQGIEAAIFVLLAAALFALAYRLVMRVR